MPPNAKPKQPMFDLAPRQPSSGSTTVTTRPAAPGGFQLPNPFTVQGRQSMLQGLFPTRPSPLDFGAVTGPTAATERLGLLRPEGAFPNTVNTSVGRADDDAGSFNPSVGPTRPSGGQTGQTGQGGSQGPTGPGARDPVNQAFLIAKLSTLADPALVQSFIQALMAQGVDIASVDVDPNTGNIVVTDSEGRPFTFTGATGRNPFEAKKLELDQAQNDITNDYNNRSLDATIRIADNEAAIARDRVANDMAIAQGNWTNALQIQDRIDERERQTRELQRELDRLQREHDQQRINIERDRLNLDRQQFLSTLQTMNPIDFMNLSRGQPLTAAGGPLPGGLQRVGPLNPIAASLASPESGAVSGTGAAAASPDGQAAPVPLPPAIAQIQSGGNPQQPLSLPEGSVRVPSAQQLNRLGPTELQYLASLVQAQGIPLEEFGRAVQERAPSSQRRTARVQ